MTISRSEFLHISALAGAGTVLAGCGPRRHPEYFPPVETEIDPKIITSICMKPDGEGFIAGLYGGGITTFDRKGTLSEILRLPGVQKISEIKAVVDPNIGEPQATLYATGSPGGFVDINKPLEPRVKDLIRLSGGDTDGFAEFNSAGIPRLLFAFGPKGVRRIEEPLGPDIQDPSQIATTLFISQEQLLGLHLEHLFIDSKGRVFLAGLPPTSTGDGEIWVSTNPLSGLQKDRNGRLSMDLAPDSFSGGPQVTTFAEYGMDSNERPVVWSGFKDKGLGCFGPNNQWIDVNSILPRVDTVTALGAVDTGLVVAMGNNGDMGILIIDRVFPDGIDVSYTQMKSLDVPITSITPINGREIMLGTEGKGAIPMTIETKPGNTMEGKIPLNTNLVYIRKDRTRLFI